LQLLDDKPPQNAKLHESSFDMPCIFRDRAKGDLLVQQTRQQAREFERIQHSARRCADCGHVFFVPPAADVLSRYYQDVYPASSISWSNVDADYETSRVKYRSELILKISARYGFGQSDRYHESGCAFGGTILELDRMGYSATGTDWNIDAVDQGRARGNASIFAKSDLEFFQHSTVRPNVVFGIYMLERMADPLGYLCELAPLLASRSIVIMLVPNAMALFPTAYGFDQYDWFSYPSKLNMYSPHSVSCLARAAGYDLLEVSTATSGLEPEATSAVSGPCLETPSTIELREQMINGGLFGEELAFVITPQGSPVSSLYATNVLATTDRCEAQREREFRIRRIGETEPTLSPVRGQTTPESVEAIQRHTYAKWSMDTFDARIPIPGVVFATSFPANSTWGNKAHQSLLAIEVEYVDDLLIGIRDHDVEGAIAEFGVFEGWWTGHLFEATERLEIPRPILGFDSFMGLSAPHPEFDSSFWEEGTYSASRQTVETNLRVAERPRIHLIEGFFADSLVTDEATAYSKIAFARIDCDIYEPSCQCLRYLATRLSHGSVLVLDDWPHRIDIGEGRAFAEWVPSVPHLKFEFLFLGTWGHLYIRVWHRDRPVFSEHADGSAVVTSTPLETTSLRAQALAAGSKAFGRISKLLRSD
jgi:hypothetical protein